MKLLNRPRIAVDIGTSFARIMKDGELLVNEPSVIAIRSTDGGVAAVGTEAIEMVGRGSEAIMPINPIKDGVIADYNGMTMMLSHFFHLAGYGLWKLRPLVLMSVAAQASEVERSAMVESALAAGAHNAFLIDSPISAAIGAGIPLAEARGNLILDMGAGKTEVAMISLGGMVVHSSGTISGNYLTNLIVEWVKKKHGVVLSTSQAEMIKINLGTVLMPTTRVAEPVRGRMIASGMPVRMELSAHELIQAWSAEPLLYLRLIKEVLGKVPPELIGDVGNRGILMLGGGAKLAGLDRMIADKIGLACLIPEEPELCVVKGANIALQNWEMIKKSL